MKKENTAIRLKRIMSERNIRQIDILNLSKPICEQYGVKMNRSDISQYCSGKVEPNQDKLFVLRSVKHRHSLFSGDVRLITLTSLIAGDDTIFLGPVPGFL